MHKQCKIYYNFFASVLYFSPYRLFLRRESVTNNVNTDLYLKIIGKKLWGITIMCPQCLLSRSISIVNCLVCHIYYYSFTFGFHFCSVTFWSFFFLKNAFLVVKMTWKKFGWIFIKYFNNFCKKIFQECFYWGYGFFTELSL